MCAQDGGPVIVDKRGYQPTRAPAGLPPRRTRIPRTMGELLPTEERDAAYARVVEYGDRTSIPPPGPSHVIQRTPCVCAPDDDWCERVVVRALIALAALMLALVVGAMLL